MSKPDFELIGIKATYTQNKDTNSDKYGDNYIELSMGDICYGRGYIVIKTDRWAIDDTQEIIDLVEDFKERCKINNLKEK